tara:strand:+ start:571 stop:825 length:255 start_codon:yes stop_codon:yes gene_type:complete
MWKLIDCGTYPWCVRETKKLKVKRNEIPMYMMSHKAYLGYLRTWPLSISPCILDRKSAKFYIDLWKNKNKTNVMKEITKQLRTI